MVDVSDRRLRIILKSRSDLRRTPIQNNKMFLKRKINCHLCQGFACLRLNETGLQKHAKYKPTFFIRHNWYLCQYTFFIFNSAHAIIITICMYQRGPLTHPHLQSPHRLQFDI